MASPPAAEPHSDRPMASLAPLTPSTGTRTPVGLRVLQLQGSAGGPTSDEAMWRKLREAGFDEEMIKRRDKAALVAYITKLEAELYEYQHHMGLLILERKEWISKYDDIKASAELADINYRRDLAVQNSSFTELQKREEKLRKAIRVEKECVMNLEKALHEMRAESAETKVAVESRLAEANLLMNNAQKKLDESESKMRAAESMQTEANLYNSSASRKLQEAEAREDELRRRLALLNSEWEAKEKDISNLRESINDTQKILQKEREKLLEQQFSLNKREEHIFERSKELDNLESELQGRREKFDKDLASFKERESSLSVNLALLPVREEAIIKRETQLDRRERELLVLQESLASREKEEIQRLSLENESVLKKLKFDAEAEVAAKKKLVEDELSTKQQMFELKGINIIQREKVVEEKEKKMELQVKTLSDKEADIAKNLELLSKKEDHISASEKRAAKVTMDLQNEREEINKMKMELEEAKNSLEDEKKQVELAHERLEITAIERSDLSLIETELKEEIDSFRAQKIELAAEVDRLRTEKEKFEAEWELIDDKKEELRREAQLVEQEKTSVAQYLKNELGSLKLEKDLLLDQFKKDSESLYHEREEFVCNMEREHSEWFGKIQHERDAFLEDIKIQKRELEISVEKRQAEIETHLREREEAFENEKKQELEKIRSQKELLAKESEKLELERERLRKEREEIAIDHEMRDKEWSEMKNYIDELEHQREKLQKARELLENEQLDINEKIQQLKELEKKNLAEGKTHPLDLGRQDIALKKSSDKKTLLNISANLNEGKATISNKGSSNTSTSAFSWVRKCTDVLGEFFVASTKLDSPETASETEHFLRTGPNNAKLEGSQGTTVLERALKGNIEEQISKSTAENLHATKTVLSKETSSQVHSSDKNLKFDERFCKENAMGNFSSIQYMNQEGRQLTDGDKNVMRLRRKRLNNSSASIDPDVRHDSLKKYQKRRRQDEVAAQRPIQDIISKSAAAEEVPQISDSPRISGQDSGEEQRLDSVTTKGDNASVVPGDLSIRGSVGETETSKVDRNTDNGETKEGLGDCVLNTNLSDLLDEEEKTPDAPHMRTRARPPVEYAVEIVALNVSSPSHSDATEEAGSLEEPDQEGEGKMSTMEKLWNFIVT